MEMEALAERLCELVREVVPEAEAVPKYGGTLFTLYPDEKEAQFCGVFAYKAHVQLSFANGAELEDAGGVLEGGGKQRRHVNVSKAGEIDVEALTPLIAQSAALTRR